MAPRRRRFGDAKNLIHSVDVGTDQTPSPETQSLNLTTSDRQGAGAPQPFRHRRSGMGGKGSRRIGRSWVGLLCFAARFRESAEVTRSVFSTNAVVHADATTTKKTT